MAYEFGCPTAGSDCSWKVAGATEEAVMAKVADHARKVHKVKTPTGTIMSYLRSTLKQV